MSVIVYFNEIRDAFLAANDSIWKTKETTAISVQEQVTAWRELHNARIFGGHYDVDKDGKPSISLRAIGLEFETKEDFVLFMFKWS